MNKKIYSVMIPAHFSVQVYVEAADEESAVDLALNCAHYDNAEFNDWGHPQDIEPLEVSEADIKGEYVYVAKSRTRRI